MPRYPRRYSRRSLSREARNVQASPGPGVGAVFRQVGSGCNPRLCARVLHYVDTHGGFARLRGRRRGPGAAAGVAVVAAFAAAAGCSSAAATTPPHSASGQLPAGRQARAEQACPVRSGWATITLGYVAPQPKVTVPPGGHLVVTVPRWGGGTPTDVNVTRAGILREQCTILLPDRARRTVFLAAAAGSTWLGAVIRPASEVMMPSWGGEATVPGS